MPQKPMQMPKMPDDDNPNLTPFQRFERLAKKVVNVPKEKAQEPKRGKPEQQS